MSSSRCSIRASANPGAPPRLPQQDTTGEAGYVAGTGLQRRAGPGFSTRVAGRPGIGWSAHQPGRPLRGRQAAVPVAATLPE